MLDFTGPVTVGPVTIHIVQPDTLAARLDSISQQVGALMAVTQDQFNQLLDRLNAATTSASQATTAIATRIQALQDSLSTLGLTEEQEEQIKQRLDGVVDSAETLSTSLQAMAANSNNPVPTPVPEPIPNA